MKHFLSKLFVSLLLLSSLNGEENTPSAVTYDFSGGRLGDNLVAYLHAKWLSYKYQMPFYFREFSYSDQFDLHFSEPLKGEAKNQYDEVMALDPSHPEIMTTKSSALFVLPYYQDTKDTLMDPKFTPVLVDWDDPEFKKIIQKKLRFVHRPKEFAIPKNRISVAVHVRKGGGFDTPDVFLSQPLKFPPNSYYIEQIKRIYNLLNRRPLYVHIFTDDLFPSKLLKEFKNATKFMNIEYGAREKATRYVNTMFDDLYMISQFRCIIRPDSNFSFVAAKMSNCKLEIYPAHAEIIGSKVRIDKVETLHH